MCGDDGSRVRAPRGDDGLFTCPNCSYSVDFRHTKRMNKHSCAPPETSTSTPVAAGPPIASRTLRERAPPPPTMLPPSPSGVSTTNLSDNDVLRKISLAIDETHKLLICRAHRVVVPGNLNFIRSHLRRSHNGIVVLASLEKDILEALHHSHVNDNPPRPPDTPVQAISGLEPPVDGFHCRNCSHAVICSDGQRHHTRKFPGHVMRPGQVQKVQQVYWKVLPAEAIHDVGGTNAFTTEERDMIEEGVHVMMNPQDAPEAKAEEDKFVFNFDPGLRLVQLIRFYSFRHASQFYKEIRLLDAYEGCKRAALVNLVAIDDKDTFCKAVSEISHYFCQRTIESDIKDLSLLTLELINGKHDSVQSPDSQGRQGTHFNPAIHQPKTREQYLKVLTRLALFLVRGCVIGDGSEDEYGIPLVFTPGQQLAANTFHEAATAYVDKEPDAKDHAADALYNLAMSVWFAPVDAIDSSSWSNAWRRFFSICSLSPKDRNIIPPNRIAIWLSELKFCMRLVACHKIRSDWVTQMDDDDAVRVDESVIYISVLWAQYSHHWLGFANLGSRDGLAKPSLAHTRRCGRLLLKLQSLARMRTPKTTSRGLVCDVSFASVFPSQSGWQETR